MRIISNFFLIRFLPLNHNRIGHFAADTELYLCEIKEKINIPNVPYKDIAFCYGYNGKYEVCNKYLLNMWKKKITIWPNSICYPITRINNIFNKFIKGGNKHIVRSSKNDRDIHNLFEKYEPSLKFSKEEEDKGADFLKRNGLKKNDKFICLIVRDSEYLSSYLNEEDFSYHKYRDINIDRFNKAIISLTDKGYYIFRMGVKVKKPLSVNHPKIIDYAYNDLRTDFLDIYLGAKCYFCVSSSTGFDAIPYIFRRPLAFVTVPIGIIFTFSNNHLSISRKHYSNIIKRNLKLSEIFNEGLAFATRSEIFDNKKITLVENTEEDIEELVLEMHNRLKNNYYENKEDLSRQEKFWQLFKEGLLKSDIIYHGKINGNIGKDFLKKNYEWIK